MNFNYTSSDDNLQVLDKVLVSYFQLEPISYCFYPPRSLPPTTTTTTTTTTYNNKQKQQTTTNIKTINGNCNCHIQGSSKNLYFSSSRKHWGRFQDFSPHFQNLKKYEPWITHNQSERHSIGEIKLPTSLSHHQMLSIIPSLKFASFLFV